MEIEPYYWLIAFVILLLIEAVTMGLTTIWFAGGSIAGFAANLLGGNIWIQIGAFLTVSFLLLVFTRPFAVKYINKDRVKTNVDELAGKIAVVTEEIDNLRACGKVQLKGMEWTARAVEKEAVIPKGETVEVLSVEGVKLIVKRKSV